MKKKTIFMVSAVILSIVFYTQITLFVIQPIGAVPEGRTLVILRLNKTNFIDSADAICDREMGGVSLLCRIMAMGAVAENGVVLLKLPYSEFLYLISTNGQEYEG